MAGTHEAALFALAVLLLNATPGVDLLLTITRTLQGGVRAGLAAAAGISAGCAVHALAAAFGLAALLSVSATAFAVIKWAGAAYLLWMAVGLLREALARGEAQARPGRAAVPARSAWVDFRSGLVTNVLNPKVALFFLAFLPQFIAPGTADKTQAFLWLGAWFVLQGGAFLALVVLLVAPLRQVALPCVLRRGVQGLAGVLFAGLAVRLALSRTGAA
ncbi:MAG: LysE family translocator [Rubrivivax sp.]|nr:LysE family translocator [Rubrivivax sp.]